MEFDAIVEEEVALEGLDGCTLERLWALLECRLQQKLDVPTKSQVWRFIIEAPDMTLAFVNPETNARKAIPPSVYPRIRDLDKVKSPAGVRVYSDPDMRRHVLGICKSPAASQLQDKDYAVLELIGRSRRAGILATELTAYFKWHAKDTSYYLKKLEQQMHLIEKQAAYAVIPQSRAKQPTSRCYLARFSPQGPEDEGDLFNAQYHKMRSNAVRDVKRALAGAPNQILYSRDVQRLLEGKYLGDTSTNTLDKKKWYTVSQKLVAAGIQQVRSEGKMCWQLLTDVKLLEDVKAPAPTPALSLGPSPPPLPYP